MSTLAACVGRRVELTAQAAYLFNGARFGYVVRVTFRGLTVQLDSGARARNLSPQDIEKWLPDR